MRHEAFGVIAAALPEHDLAKVLLMAGLHPSKLLACLHGQLSVQGWVDHAHEILAGEPFEQYSKTIHLSLNLQNVRRFAGAVSSSSEALHRLLEVMPVLWKGFLDRPDTRYRVMLRHPGSQLDLQWLAHVLTTSGIGVEAVVNETRHGVESHWEWPLRIGVLPTPAGDELLKTLKEDRYSELYDVNTASNNSTQFDLLLFTGSLAEVKERRIPLGLKVGALLVLGAPEAGREATTKSLRKHLYRQRASVAAVCFVPTEERMPWLKTVVRELSHNATLDTALFRARLATERQREGANTGIGDLQSPLVFGGEEFLQGARISEVAKRIGKVMQAHKKAEQVLMLDNVPDIFGRARSIKDVGNQLVLGAPSYVWDSERGDAANLARVRRQVEAHVGPLESIPIAGGLNSITSVRQEPFWLADVSAGPLDFAMAGPPKVRRRVARAMADLDLLAPTSTAPTEDRHVQCRVTQGEASEESIKRLRPGEIYRALIHIGPKRDEALIVAGEIFDERLLPPSEHGHDLDIVFCPLGIGPAVKPAPPMVRRVHLPKHGDSDTAEFYFSSSAEPDKFRARVIVLHRNRIIQTLLLRTPELGQDLALEAENLVTPFLGVSEIETAADLAFVINDSTYGKPGITTVSSDTASFIEPAGLAQSIDTIKKLLSDMNVSAVGSVTKLDDKDMVSLMIDLAHHGVAILREIEAQLPIAPYESAVRVQVVEAVANAYLPVEFLYSGKAPKPGAKLCPNAAAALRNGDAAVHRDCAHAKDPDYVCPAAFWGFSKCIERQAFGLGKEHVFSVPQSGMEELAPFQSAVVAASKRVDSEDMTGPAGLETELKGVVGTLRSAMSWDDWQAKVQDAPAPTLLVLLPHSANSPKITNMPALEIADDWLESSRLDKDYVHPAGGTDLGPLVLLLGCSTTLTEIAFLNFVREFKRSGASIVLGTLATIHGKQATSFAIRLLSEMKKQGNGQSFDQILLKVKQQLLADGEPFVLSLASYGHSSWLIKI